MKQIPIEPVPGTTLAENKDSAAKLREEILLPALSNAEKVVIDFHGIDTVTQSFIHALIADAIREYGDKAFDLLEFKDCQPGVKHIIRTVFEYTLLAKQDAGDSTSPASG